MNILNFANIATEPNKKLNYTSVNGESYFIEVLLAKQMLEYL